MFTPEQKKRKFLIVSGRSGSGKTRFLQSILLPRFSRLFVVDPMEEYEGDAIFSSFEMFNDYMQDLDTLPDSFLYVCRFNDPEDVFAIMEYAPLQGNVCLCIDEFNIYINDETGGFENEHVQNIVRRGRHSRVSLVFSTQLLPDIPPAIRAHTTTVVTFAQSEPYVLRHLALFQFDPLEVQRLVNWDTQERTPNEEEHFLQKGEPFEMIQE